jgi:hypothetical protein
MFSPSPDALSRVGLSQRERRGTNPSPTEKGVQNEPLSRGRGAGVRAELC